MNSVAFDALRFLNKSLPESLRWRCSRTLRRFAQRFAKNLPPRTVICSGGFKLHVDMEEFIGSHIAFTSEYEPGLSLLLSKYLRSNSNFVDVGANIGYFSMLASSIVTTGRITAIEAIAENFEKLRANVELNSCEDRVCLMEIAVWDSSEILEFTIPHAGSSGMASVREVSQVAKRVKVEAKPLDELITAENRPVSVMKMDIEGAELNALLGAQAIMREDKPILFLELSQRYLKQLGFDSVSLVKKLEDEFDYSLFLYDENGKTWPLREEDLAEDKGDFQYNIVAFSQGQSGSDGEQMTVAAR